MTYPPSSIDRGRLAELTDRELRRFADGHPVSADLFARGQQSLIGGVPMPWMMRWASGIPPFAARAAGATITDVDGHEYADLCLGDTGAMTGHGPPSVLAALAEQGQRGITTMLPTGGLAVGGRGTGAPLRGGPVAVHAERDGLRTARRCVSRGRSPAAPRSWCSATATTARWTRRSRCGTQAGRQCPGKATWDRRSIPRRPPSRWSSTTWTPCRKRWPRGRWPACWPSAAMTNMAHHPARPRLPPGAAGTHPGGGRAADHRRDAHAVGRAGEAARQPGASTRTWSRWARPSAAAWRPGRWASAARRWARCWPRSIADYEDTGGIGGTLRGQRDCQSAAMRGHAGDRAHPGGLGPDDPAGWPAFRRARSRMCCSQGRPGLAR